VTEATPTPTPAPEPTPTPTPAPAAAEDPAAAKLAEIQEQLKAAQAERDALKKAQADKEKAEREATLSAEQKHAEAEALVKTLQRDNLIARVRLSAGYTDKVYDVVRPDGDTEDEIKKAFEGHKAALDEFVKSQGAKPGQGGGTGGGITPGSEPAKTDNQPYLVRLGLVGKKQAV